MIIALYESIMTDYVRYYKWVKVSYGRQVKPSLGIRLGEGLIGHRGL